MEPLKFRLARPAAFIYTIIDGHLTLLQRARSGHKGLWGPAGGKVAEIGDLVNEEDWRALDFATNHELWLDENWQRDLDYEAQAGREHHTYAALRETIEELKHDANYLHCLRRGDFTNLVYLGKTTDEQWKPDRHERFDIHFYAAMLSTQDINPYHSEVRALSPATHLAYDELWPKAQEGIAHLKWELRNLDGTGGRDTGLLALREAGVLEQLAQVPSTRTLETPLADYGIEQNTWGPIASGTHPSQSIHK